MLKKLKAWAWEHRGKLAAIAAAAATIAAQNTKWAPILDKVLGVLGGSQ